MPKRPSDQPPDLVRGERQAPSGFLVAGLELRRLRAGLSQAELCRRADVARSTYNAFLTGQRRTIQVAVLNRLDAALGDGDTHYIPAA